VIRTADERMYDNKRTLRRRLGEAKARTR